MKLPPRNDQLAKHCGGIGQTCGDQVRDRPLMLQPAGHQQQTVIPQRVAALADATVTSEGWSS